MRRFIPTATTTACLLFAVAAGAQTAISPPPPPVPAASGPGATPPPPPLAPPGAAGPAGREQPAAPGAAGPGGRHHPPAPRGTEPMASNVSLTGQISRWLVNPNGEVDGLLLADGTQVAFPPHLSASVLQAVKLKDTVLITGTRAGAAAALRAVSIRSSTGQQTVTDQPAAAGEPPRPPRDAAALKTMSADGRIDRVLTTSRGDANGVLLANGTIVRFPPHAGAGLGAALKPGATLYASGYGSSNAYGSAFEATRIGSSADSAREVYTRPAGGPGAAPDRGIAPGAASAPRAP